MPDIKALLIKSRQLFPECYYLSPETVKHNRRAWVRSVLHLGHRWVGLPNMKRN